jgi:hypothetical protein
VRDPVVSRADTTGSRALVLVCVAKQARANELITEGDGYTFIAAPRSPDLRHTSKRRRHLCYVVAGVLPRISIGTWGLCARLCLVLVCGGRYGLGGGFFSSSWDRVWAE